MLKLGAYRNGGFGDGLIASAQLAGIRRYFKDVPHALHLLYWGPRIKEICASMTGLASVEEARETPSSRIRGFGIWFELKPCPMFCSQDHFHELPDANLTMLCSALQVDKDYWGPQAGNDIIRLYKQYDCIGQPEFLSRLTGIPMSITDAHLPQASVPPQHAVDGPYIAICGGQRAHKKWMVKHGWTKVVAHAGSLGYRVVQLGAMDELALTGCTWRKHLPLAQQIALLRGAAAFVGCDGFLCHAAAAMNIPSVVLWGGTPWTVWGYRNQVHIVAPGENCWWVHMKPNDSLTKSQIAMNRITAEAVMAGVDKALQKTYTVTAEKMPNQCVLV
jgi:hypothetical protein